MNIPVEKAMNLADGKLLYDDLRDRAESQVVIGEDEPQSETTKLWVDTDETGADYEVPTLQEFNTAIAGKISEPANEGTNGQVLTTDGHGGRSWRTVQGGGGSNIDDTAGEGDTDVTWSADKLTSELGAKEDKPGLTITFTIMPDTSSQTPGFVATCDKTKAEIVQAHTANEKIEAVFSLYGQITLPARLLFSQSGQVTTIMADSTYTPEGAPVFIIVFGNTSSATWEVDFYQTMATDMFNRNSSFIAYSKRISYLGEPTDSGDATTKNYVDTALATKEDKPGLEVTFTVVVSKQIVTDGENPYTVTCDTSDSDIVNAHDNGEKIRAVADIAGMRVELPLYMVETVPNVGSLMMFMGRSVDLYSIGSGGLSNVGFGDVVLTKAAFMGQQDWSIQFQNPIDIQINGTSIVSNGVANIPKASNSSLGVVKTETNYGIMVNSSNGRIYIDSANSLVVKTGTDNFRPIVPYNQHIASFYGLAKAAGDTTQAASSNPVGAYTDDAKTAIKQMFGFPNVATIMETQAIIDAWDEEDEGMLVETELFNNGQYDVGYKTLIDASEIETAFKNGKNVVVHFSPDQNGIPIDTYYQLAVFGDEDETLNSPKNFGFADINLRNQSAQSSFIFFSKTEVGNDGKLYFYLSGD